MGLDQGSGSTNPEFALTTTPMVNAYKRKNFHDKMRSAWSGLLMILAAIMYVDDMNMLLKALENYLIEEFFPFIDHFTTRVQIPRGEKLPQVDFPPLLLLSFTTLTKKMILKFGDRKLKNIIYSTKSPVEFIILLPNFRFWSCKKLQFIFYWKYYH